MSRRRRRPPLPGRGDGLEAGRDREQINHMGLAASLDLRTAASLLFSRVFLIDSNPYLEIWAQKRFSLQPWGVGLPGITRKRLGFPRKILDSTLSSASSSSHWERVVSRPHPSSSAIPFAKIPLHPPTGEFLRCKRVVLQASSARQRHTHVQFT